MTTPLPPDLAGAPTPQPVAPPTAPPQQYFTAEQLKAARQQEKDKLYGRQKQLEDQVKGFQEELASYRQEKEAAESQARKAQEEADTAARKAAEEKLSVQELLQKRDDEWKQQQKELKDQLELERTIMQRDRELMSLQSYIQRRVAEEVAKDSIAPEFLDYIDGSNEAEVEASIAKAQEKTATILAGMSGQNPTPIVTPGVSPTGFAPAGPLDTLSGTQNYSAEDIKKMNNEEYKAFRAKVGIDKAGNNRGLFN